jgi:SAM-dependent methyltransferase
MRMSAVEKWFVNARRHGDRTARHAEGLVALATPRGARYLEVGCGNGTAVRRIAEVFGLQATGVDVDPDQIRLAGQRVPAGVRFLTADARRLPFDAAAFDIVSSFKTTHHVQNWTAALHEMARVVRPGGHLIYFDFVLAAPLAALGRALMPGAGFPTIRAIADLADAVGLDPVHQRRSALHYEVVWCRRGGADRREGATSSFRGMAEREGFEPSIPLRA